MNRRRFESHVREKIGAFRTQEIEPGTVEYVITEAKARKYSHAAFSITDRKYEGISVSFYNTILKTQQTIEGIYHWADAYKLLYKGLIEPKALVYREEAPETISIKGTLGYENNQYDFVWEYHDEFADVPEETFNASVEMVKYGLIESLVYEEEKDRVIINARVNPCHGKKSPQELLALVIKSFWDPNSVDVGTMRLTSVISDAFSSKCRGFHDEENEDFACGGAYCILYLCGYIEYAAMQGILPELLEKRKDAREHYRQGEGVYQFRWEPEDGLRYLDESRFNLAWLMAVNNMVSVGKELTDTNQIRIDSEYEWVCKVADAGGPRKATAASMAWSAEADEYDGNSGYFSYSPKKTLDGYSPFDDCRDCIHAGHCIYVYAAYIKYLLDCEKEEAVWDDREWFAENEKSFERMNRNVFSFSITEEHFLDMPEDFFEIAEYLQENNYVSMGRELEITEGNEKKLCITISYELPEDKNTFGDIKALKAECEEGSLTRTPANIISCDIGRFESGYILNGYIIAVMAGYVDYLRNTGQYDAYRDKLEQHRQRTEESFDLSRQEAPALEKVLAIAENEQESGLYCIIEGERGVGKREIVRQIARLLTQAGKIDDADYEDYTFGQIATQLVYTNPNSQGTEAYDDLYFVYEEFEKRKLYVLTDLKEFIYSSRNAVDGDGSKYSHMIKLLGRYQPETYIIIIDEKKNVEKFLALSPQIRFLFGGNVIKVQNMTSEKLFAAYSDKLTRALKEQLEQDDGFKDRFLDYIALNRKLLPLGNIELADYLANYSNLQKDLVLPPDVYRQRSAKEMLQAVIGMESVKKTVHEFEKYAVFVKRAEMEGMSIPDSNMHMIFAGNPGTGKTMIARVIGQMLYDLGIIEENKLIEVESKDLKAQYIGESAIKTDQIIEKAMGGVLFIDEAYALGSDSFAEEIIATLIKAMEDRKDKFVVIFAGYDREMQEFLNINSGIASRIGYTFKFEDYTVEELTQMFALKMERAGFLCEDDIWDDVQKVCAYFREKKNFGNGRFIDKLVQRVIVQHAMKENKAEEINVIGRRDIPTIESMISNEVVKHNDYRERLNAFIGMENVKAKVCQFADFVQFQQKARAAGANIPAGNMHMIFTGNPGTGKTTIARIMAELLYDIGILKENKLVEVERKDLVAEYVGQTSVKTAEVIERALGGVLFIDEAYTLAPKDADSDFGAEAVATLIKAMEDHKNDLIVIFAGYQDEMRQFLNINPGIASRIGNTFDFEDYTPDEMVKIYQHSMQQAGFSVNEAALDKVGIISGYFSKKKHFGNGRFVAKLQQETLMRHAGNLHADESNLLEITAKDVPDISDLSNTIQKKRSNINIDHIIGMRAVKEKLKEFESLVNFRVVAREHGLSIPDANMHMIFSGNPGTGKTTIARIIAQKLYDIGIIMENKLVEVERKDLIAGYVGQTATKTGEILEKAMGGILFIDEAYTLTSGSENDFGSEAIATLIKAMEDHKDDLIVIFAGYKEEMKQFINANPGIASRIGFTFHFENYTADELVKMFVNKLESNGFTVTEQAQNKVEILMQRFCGTDNFGNGRFVDSIVQHTLTAHAGNYDIKSVAVIDENDVPEAEALLDADTVLA